jgi:hypothetical protein
VNPQNQYGNDERREENERAVEAWRQQRIGCCCTLRATEGRWVGLRLYEAVTLPLCGQELRAAPLESVFRLRGDLPSGAKLQFFLTPKVR